MQKKTRTKGVIAYLIQQCIEPSGVIGRMMLGIWNRTFRKMALWGLHHVDLSAAQNLLEIGFGGGQLMHHLATTQPKLMLTGIDISAAAVKKATHMNKQLIASGRMHLQQLPVENLSTLAQTFDVVLAVQTHIYWREFEAAVHNIYSFVAPGGSFHLICEKDKIVYHLPQYREPRTVLTLMKTSDFSEVHFFETEQWVHYQMQK